MKITGNDQRNSSFSPSQCTLMTTVRIYNALSFTISFETFIITDRVRSTREGYVLTRVCPSVCPRGSTPPVQAGRGVPRPGPDGGYPSQVQLRVGGTLARSHSTLDWGYPCQVQIGGYPHPALDGRCPHSTLDGGYPCQVQTGGPPARGYPPIQDNRWEYLIRRSRYASCVHAGGLSCLK